MLTLHNFIDKNGMQNLNVYSQCTDFMGSCYGNGWGTDTQLCGYKEDALIEVLK